MKSQGFFVEQVDDSAEFILAADRQLQQYRLDMQFFDHGDQYGTMVGADPIHLVDQADARHPVAVGLPPDRFALWLNAFHRAENSHRTIQGT